MTGIKHPLTLTSLVLALVGFGLSAYLTYVHYNVEALVCGTGGCELVQTSRYSEVFGIPIAIFGLIMFTLLILGIVLRDVRTEMADTISTGMLVMLIAAVLYWAYLTYLELEVIHAVCQWCVMTSLVTVGLLIVEACRWYQCFRNIGSA